MSDGFRNVVGNRAWNSLSREVRRIYGGERRPTDAEIAAYAQQTPDRDLLLLSNFGKRSLARVRDVIPFEPDPSRVYLSVPKDVLIEAIDHLGNEMSAYDTREKLIAILGYDPDDAQLPDGGTVIRGPAD